jgi:uncharacterized protein (TIGR02246 family)
MATVKSTVQSVLDRYIQAVEASDVDALLTLYSNDVHVYDMIMPFERHGIESGREMIAAWLNEGGKQDCSIEDLEVLEEGDLAVARASVRYGFSQDDGTHHEMWNRATWTLRRIDGEWKIVAEHTSVPLSEPDMQPVFEARDM